MNLLFAIILLTKIQVLFWHFDFFLRYLKFEMTSSLFLRQNYFIMKATNHFFFSLLFAFLLIIPGFSQITYQVVMVKGQVIYDEMELKRGDRIELEDLDEGSNLRDQLQYFSFGSDKDALHLLDVDRRKIVVVPAQAVRPGRDLMLATRGIKYIRSDFEFQRAFTPGESVIALLSEDTLVCRGLQKYRFTGNEFLVAVFKYQGWEFKNIIGRNDTLFLTRDNLFRIDPDKGLDPVNSFEISNIRLFITKYDSLGIASRELDIQPFSLYFLEDMINYFVAASYDGIIMEPDDIFNMLVPNFITEKQIQREYNLLTAEKARQWMYEKINSALESQ